MEAGVDGVHESASRPLLDSMGIQDSEVCNSRSTHSLQLWLETRATLKLASGDE